MTFKAEFFGGPLDGEWREVPADVEVERVFASGMRFENLTMPKSVEADGHYYRLAEIRPGFWGYRWLAPE